MGKIKILDESVSNMIAAGEVVENPASMVKELLENAIDAGASKIEISVNSGGHNVKITDNGVGMEKSDLLLCVERHATSKISKKDDLFNLTTFGFRGEALSSICAVARVKLSSKMSDKMGTVITLLGGKMTSINSCERSVGTTIEISDLFFNTPARLKFLRKKTTEYANIKEIVMQESLSVPNVAITLNIDGKLALRTSGNGVENTIGEIFGSNVLKNLQKFEYGYLGNADLYRSNKDFIFTFVNNRTVKSKIIRDAVIDGYYTKLMKGKYPFAIIFMDLDPKEVDINVHPSKKIVKFSNDDEIYHNISESVRNSFDEVFISPKITTQQKENFFDFSEFDEILNEKKYMKQVDLSEIDENFDNKINNDLEYKVSQEHNFVAEESKNNIINDELPINKYNDFDDFAIVNPNKIKDLKFRVVGQLFDTFILVERDDELEIYDQHIIHERILYEKLKSMFYANTSSQHLLMPIKVSLLPNEMAILSEHMADFKNAGFEIDTYPQGVLIRSIPKISFKESVENIFREMIDNLTQKKYKDIRENILISMSCKGAIKANHRLTYDEMYKMVRKLHEVGEYTCPHGRPIIVKITHLELEKLFKRKI